MKCKYVIGYALAATLCAGPALAEELTATVFEPDSDGTRELKRSSVFLEIPRSLWNAGYLNGRQKSLAVAAGTAAGGREPHPAMDYGFMYQRQLNDPDGNILEFGYMDPAAAQHGPEAFANQQA